jgi:hypothetical protein
MEVFVILAVYIFGSILAANIAKKKGRRGGGYFLLSLLLSPLVGILAALVAAPNEQKVERDRIASGTERKCPHCAEVIKVEAKVCRFCGRDVLPGEAAHEATGESRFKSKAEYEAWKAEQAALEENRTKVQGSPGLP